MAEHDVTDFALKACMALLIYNKAIDECVPDGGGVSPQAADAWRSSDGKSLDDLFYDALDLATAALALAETDPQRN